MNPAIGKQNINISMKSLSMIFLNKVILYTHSKQIIVANQKTISVIFFLFIIISYLIKLDKKFIFAIILTVKGGVLK